MLPPKEKPPGTYQRKKTSKGQGNTSPNMSGLKKLPKGTSGNPGGFTKEMRALKEEQARKADVILSRMIEAVGNNSDSDEAALGMIQPNVLNLLHKAIERVEGRAKQSVDLSSQDGSMSPAAAVSDAVLEALKRKHDPDA